MTDFSSPEMSELAIWSAAATSKTSGAVTEGKPVDCSKEIDSTPRILTPAGFAAGGRLIDPQWERVSNDDGTEGTWHGSLRFCLAPTGTSKFLDGRVFKSLTSIAPPRTRANARSRARLQAPDTAKADTPRIMGIDWALLGILLHPFGPHP